MKTDPTLQYDSKDIAKRTANLLRGQPRAIALWMIGMFGGTMDHKLCDKDTQESFQRGVRGMYKGEVRTPASDFFLRLRRRNLICKRTDTLQPMSPSGSFHTFPCYYHPFSIPTRYVVRVLHTAFRDGQTISYGQITQPPLRPAHIVFPSVRIQRQYVFSPYDEDFSLLKFKTQGVLGCIGYTP